MKFDHDFSFGFGGSAEGKFVRTHRHRTRFHAGRSTDGDVTARSFSAATFQGKQNPGAKFVDCRRRFLTAMHPFDGR